jgi:hypothetical protein
VHAAAAAALLTPLHSQLASGVQRVREKKHNQWHALLACMTVQQAFQPQQEFIMHAGWLQHNNQLSSGRGVMHKTNPRATTTAYLQYAAG